MIKQITNYLPIGRVPLGIFSIVPHLKISPDDFYSTVIMAWWDSHTAYSCSGKFHLNFTAIKVVTNTNYVKVKTCQASLRCSQTL